MYGRLERKSERFMHLGAFLFPPAEMGFWGEIRCGNEGKDYGHTRTLRWKVRRADAPTGICRFGVLLFSTTLVMGKGRMFNDIVQHTTGECLGATPATSTPSQLTQTHTQTHRLTHDVQ